LFLLDVRTVEQVEKNGHIGGAVPIPLAEVLEKLDKLPSFDSPIVGYCGSGQRLTITKSILNAYTYADVHSMESGLDGWDGVDLSLAGAHPVVSLGDALDTFLAAME
jgi:rhodanese-related sulfurtransferase